VKGSEPFDLLSRHTLINNRKGKECLSIGLGLNMRNLVVSIFDLIFRLRTFFINSYWFYSDRNLSIVAFNIFPFHLVS
jgi:hypothetical protein